MSRLLFVFLLVSTLNSVTCNSATPVTFEDTIRLATNPKSEREAENLVEKDQDLRMLLVYFFLVTEKYEEAIKFVDDGALKGGNNLSLLLYTMYVQGIGVVKDKDKAMIYLGKSLKNNRPNSITNKLDFDYSDARKKFNQVLNEIAMDTRTPFSLYICSVLQTTGIAKNNANSGEQLLLKSAEKGFFLAQITLADILLERGEKNQALEWYERAAKSGDPLSQFWYARVLYGLEQPESDLEAFNWFTRAAAQSENYSKAMLATMYMEGRGVAKNQNLAYQLAREAAVEKNEVGEFLVGRCFSVGFGVPRDETIAQEWYRRSAEQNFPPALKILKIKNRGKKSP